MLVLTVNTMLINIISKYSQNMEYNAIYCPRIRSDDQNIILVYIPVYIYLHTVTLNLMTYDSVVEFVSSLVSQSQFVCKLSVIFDEILTFNDHIDHACKAAYL